MPLVPELVERGARFLLVGQGEPHVEDQLMDMADKHAGKVAVRIAFDPPLSRRVYAGADYFLVPSRFEPCGLTQMYAMRYGSIPIVTDVGGLHDTVDPIGARPNGGTGFVAPEATTAALKAACDAALTLSREKKAEVIQRAMAKDFAWAGPARTYEALYTSAREG
jgi:starch synthase